MKARAYDLIEKSYNDTFMLENWALVSKPWNSIVPTW